MTTASSPRQRPKLFLQTDIDFIEDPRLHEVADAIEDDVQVDDWIALHIAASTIPLLWRHLFKRNCRDGLFETGTTARTIAKICKYKGNAERFFQALKAHEWVLIHDNGRIEGGAFLKWYGPLIAKWEEKAEKEAARRQKAAKEKEKLAEQRERRKEQKRKERAEKKAAGATKSRRGFASQERQGSDVAATSLRPSQPHIAQTVDLTEQNASNGVVPTWAPIDVEQDIDLKDKQTDGAPAARSVVVESASPGGIIEEVTSWAREKGLSPFLMPPATMTLARTLMPTRAELEEALPAFLKSSADCPPLVYLMGVVEKKRLRVKDASHPRNSDRPAAPKPKRPKAQSDFLKRVQDLVYAEAAFDREANASWPRPTPAQQDALCALMGTMDAEGIERVALDVGPKGSWKVLLDRLRRPAHRVDRKAAPSVDAQAGV